MTEVAFEIRGEGSPLLLVHGLGGDRHVWGPVAGALAAERRVIAVDLPGFGASPPLTATPTPRALALAVAGLLDRLRLPRTDVAGNSLGGWVALELARLGRATAVTAIAPAGFWGRALGPRPGRRTRDLPGPIRAALPALAGVGPLRRAALLGVVAHPERVPTREARRIVRSYLGAPGFDAANDAMRSDYIRPGALREIDAPITLAWADRDRLVGRPRGGVPGTHEVVIEDAGHLAMWDRPDAVIDLLLRRSAVSDPRSR